MLEIPKPEKPKEKFPNVDPEIAKNLEEIDFDKMRNLFSQKIFALGLDAAVYEKRLLSEGKNFVDSVSHGEKSAIGSFQIMEDKIHVDKKYFKDKKEEGFIFGEFVYVLSIVSHEETHALADRYIIKDSEKIDDPDSIYTSGYASISRHEFLWHSFNEAVTELISREILQDYFADQRQFGETATYDNYNSDIELFNKIHTNICNECGIDADVFWKVIQRGYFAGEQLSADNISRLFKDVFPEDFIDKIIKAKALPNEKEVANIISLFNQSLWTDKDRNRIRRYIMSIYHTMPNSQEK